MSQRRIRKIQIQDFRGIDALGLDFTDSSGAPLDVAVLAGGNGSGKTTALEAILLVLGRRDALPGSLREQIRFGSAEAKIEVTVDHKGGNWWVGIGVGVREVPPRDVTESLPSIEYFSAGRPKPGPASTRWPSRSPARWSRPTARCCSR